MGLKTIDIEKAPGYIVLEASGKSVIRPGGIQGTKKMLQLLNITTSDTVVEFGGGAGKTTKMILKKAPRDYVVVERNEKFGSRIEKILKKPYSCVIGSAQESGLATDYATRVFGEAMLTMQTSKTKGKIMQEAGRILKTGGLYAIHEVGFAEGLTAELRDQISEELIDALNVGARPLTIAEWSDMLSENGFSIKESLEFRMNVFSPKNFLSDEGLRGTMRIMKNMLTNRRVRGRMNKIRRVFSKYSLNLSGTIIIAQKE